MAQSQSLLTVCHICGTKTLRCPDPEDGLSYCSTCTRALSESVTPECHDCGDPRLAGRFNGMDLCSHCLQRERVDAQHPSRCPDCDGLGRSVLPARYGAPEQLYPCMTCSGWGDLSVEHLDALRTDHEEEQALDPWASKQDLDYEAWLDDLQADLDTDFLGDEDSCDVVVE